MHIPKLDRPDITETWLYAFDTKKDATFFADTLLHFYQENQQWPSRIVPEYIHIWRCVVPESNRRRKKRFSDKDSLDIHKTDLLSLLRIASLENMIVRRLVRDNLGDFVTLPSSERAKVSECDVVKHLHGLFSKTMIDAEKHS